MPPECPTCHAPEPHLHPQCGRTGEVHPCPDPFHTQITAENTQEKIDLMRRLRAILDTQSAVQACPDDLLDFKKEVLDFAYQAILRRGWTDIPLLTLTVVKGTDVQRLQGTTAALWTRECQGFRQHMLEFSRDTLGHYADHYNEQQDEPPRVLQ